MKKLTLVIIILFVSVSVFATDSNDSEPETIEITIEEAQNAIKAKEELKVSKKTITELENQIRIRNREIEKLKSENFWLKVGLFASGAAITGLGITLTLEVIR